MQSQATNSVGNLLLEKEHEFIFNDGEIVAVRQTDSVEVYSANFKQFFGVLPVTATADDVTNAMNFFKAGYRKGGIAGKNQARKEIRAALGIFKD